MSFFLKIKKVKTPEPAAEEKKPLLQPAEKKTYEESHALERLEFLITIVNEGQDGAIVKILMDHDASVAFSSHGKGTASSDLYEVFGLSNRQK